MVLTFARVIVGGALSREHAQGDRRRPYREGRQTKIAPGRSSGSGFHRTRLPAPQQRQWLNRFCGNHPLRRRVRGGFSPHFPFHPAQHIRGTRCDLSITHSGPESTALSQSQTTTRTRCNRAPLPCVSKGATGRGAWNRPIRSWGPPVGSRAQCSVLCYCKNIKRGEQKLSERVQTRCVGPGGAGGW